MGNEISVDRNKGVPIVSLLGGEAVKKRFKELLGSKAPGFISSILSAVNSNTELMNAEPNSIVSAAAIAASLDLPINSNLGFAHIVPYRKDGHPVAQFQMGWRGFVQLALRTGQYKTINATKVFEGEIQSVNRFTGDVILSQTGKTSDLVVGYLAYFRLINGFEKYYYMSKEEVGTHAKKYSKSYESKFSKWQQDFDAMALKTVLKMLLSKYGILSIGMETAIQADQAMIKDDGSYYYVDNDSQAESVSKGKPVVTMPQEKPPQTVSVSVKEQLKKELDDYCREGGDDYKKAVLEEISTFKDKDGKNHFVTDLDNQKVSEKWCGTILGNLRRRIEEENKLLGMANEVAMEEGLGK
jgi:recombination protein RecT